MALYSDKMNNEELYGLYCKAEDAYFELTSPNDFTRYLDLSEKITNECQRRMDETDHEPTKQALANKIKVEERLKEFVILNTPKIKSGEEK